MTHAECQDLLLDLAYGELSSGRASEVAAHLAGCEECRKEKALLDQTRRATAPLREVEEPPPGFDDRILEAARTQASLEHDGNLGQVIEVSGKVSPLGLEAARIDAHANPKMRVGRARPRWVLRAAVGGSIAAAAAVALLVSTTSRRQETPAHPEEFQIRVQPAAPQAVDTALREGEAKREAQAAAPAAQQPAPPFAGAPAAQQSPLTAPAAPPPPAEEGERNAAPLAPKVARSEKTAAEGSGGDAADSYLPAKAGAPAVARPAPPASLVPSSLRAANAPVQGPADLEAGAQRARHAGNYPLAAGLYRKAAALRRDAGNDPATAAWDLAHAVECLAAGGLFEEARQVGQDLSKLHPSEVDARAAARRALREVDVPAADR
jgi:Putative zinc-finger